MLPASVGGKAQRLARLTSLGFPIPRWFVILPDAFHASATASDPGWRRRIGDWDAFQKWVSSLELLPEAREEIDRLLSGFADGENLFAISPSPDAVSQVPASTEQRTRLFVPGNEVPGAVAALWGQVLKDRAPSSRSDRKLDVLPPPPAVIVQEMVDAEVSGVAFSADPATGRRGVAVVSACWGLGPGLVSSDGEADTWQIGREGKVSGRRIVSKAMAHRRSAGMGCGTAPAPLPPTHRDQPCLTEEQVQIVASTARSAAALCGRPMEIEWGWAQGRIHVLRGRELVSLASQPDPEGARCLWDGSQITGSYPGVTTPLTFSVARASYAAVYGALCRLLSVSGSKLFSRRTTLTRMVGLVRGRVYYNLASWHELCAILPGSSVYPGLVSRIVGDDPAPMGVDAADARPRLSWIQGCCERLRAGRMILWLALRFLGLRREVVRFKAHAQSILAPPVVPLPVQRIDELTRYYQQLESELLLRWDPAVANDLFALILSRTLTRFCRRWTGDLAQTFATDLLGPDRSTLSLEPARRIRAMAVFARRNAPLTEAFCTGNVEEIELRLASDPRLQSACADFLEEFGERCLEELKLETPSLGENPLPLYRAIGHASRRGLGLDPDEIATPRQEAEIRARRILEGHRLRRLVFGWLLRKARHAVRERDELHILRARMFGRFRSVFLEIGRRLAAEGRLDDARDIFLLTAGEVVGFVDGTAVTADLRALVSVRRQEVEGWTRLPQPAGKFFTHGAVHIGNRFQAEGQEPVQAPLQDMLQGLACCPGVVRGRARVVADSGGTNVQAGEILVAERAEPGWVLLCPMAAGLLLEHGTLLSPCALAAREMNVPTITSLPRLTAWVRDGEWIEMDGATGTVRKVPAPTSEN